MSQPVEAGHVIRRCAKMGPYLLVPARDSDVMNYDLQEPMWALPGMKPVFSTPLRPLARTVYEPRFVNYQWLAKRANRYGWTLEMIDYPCWRSL